MSPTANDVALGLSLGGPAGTRTQDTRIKSFGLTGKRRPTECIQSPLSWTFTKAD